MKRSPASTLYIKIKEAIQASGKDTFGFTISGLADLVVPGGSQNDWAMDNVRNQLSIVLSMALEEGIWSTAVNKLYFQVYENGGGPDSVRAALPFIAQGGKGKGTAGVVFETNGKCCLLQASQVRTGYNLKVAVTNFTAKNNHLAELGAFPQGEIERLSEPKEFLRLKQ